MVKAKCWVVRAAIDIDLKLVDSPVTVFNQLNEIARPTTQMLASLALAVLVLSPGPRASVGASLWFS